MTIVIGDITMSLDGFVTGVGADPRHGLGDAEDLHTWVMEPGPVDTEVLEHAVARSGAVVMGRRLFDVVDGPDGWTAEMGYGAGAGVDARPPFFVPTHHAPERSRLVDDVGLRIDFVDDLVTAIARGREAAAGLDVVIMGGGDVVGQALEADLVDELHLHLVPMLLGDGTPLFRPGSRRRFRQREVRPSEHATHLVYERTSRPT